MKKLITQTAQQVSKRRVVIAGIVFALIAAVAGLAFGLKQNQAPGSPQTQQSTTQSVQAATLAELQQEITLTRTALLTPNEETAIVARTGGRITNLNAHIGDLAVAGAVIGKIDGGNEPNPLAAQVQSAATVRSLFNLIERQALASTDNAVALAQQSLQAAQAGQLIGLDIQRTTIDITGTSLDQALLSARNAKEIDIDATIDAAKIGVDAAKLASELAISQAELQNRSATDAVAAATLNVRTAEIARERTRAELASQRAQLSGQLAVLQEQLGLQDIVTASNGTITSLTVKEGDFVSQNQELGTVATADSGRLELEVPKFIAAALAPDAVVAVDANKRPLTARVEAVSQLSDASGLFNLVLVIDGGVPADAYGKQAKVTFTASSQGSTYLVPLDAIAIRSSGPTIFTVSPTGSATLHRVTVHGYHGDVAEISAALAPTDRIITTNTRLLQDGSPVDVVPAA